MRHQSQQYRGIDYEIQRYPGKGVTGWSAILSKDGHPIMTVSGQLQTPDGRHEAAPVELAVRLEIDAEFDLATSGQSRWGQVFK